AEEDVRDPKLGVPRTQVAGQRDRNFRLPPSVPGQPIAEPLEKARVGGVPHRIRIGIRTPRELEAHRGTSQGELVDLDGGEFSPLDAPKGRLAHPDRSSGSANTE